MVFGWVIAQVGGPRGPIHKELLLTDAVLYPVIAHVHCAGLLLFHRLVGNSHGSGVVDLDWCGWLGVVHFGQGGADGHCLL